MPSTVITSIEHAYFSKSCIKDIIVTSLQHSAGYCASAVEEHDL